MKTKDLTKKFQAEGITPKPEDMTCGEICVFKATNRQVLIAFIGKYVNSEFFDGEEGKVYLRLVLGGEKLGCEGCSIDYATEADVPYHSVSCPCGNPNHWLIKYEEE